MSFTLLKWEKWLKSGWLHYLRINYRAVYVKFDLFFFVIYEKVSDRIHFLPTFENFYQISPKFIKMGHKRFGRFLEFPME